MGKVATASAAPPRPRASWEAQPEERLIKAGFLLGLGCAEICRLLITGTLLEEQAEKKRKWQSSCSSEKVTCREGKDPQFGDEDGVFVLLFIKSASCSCCTGKRIQPCACVSLNIPVEQTKGQPSTIHSLQVSKINLWLGSVLSLPKIRGVEPPEERNPVPNAATVLLPTLPEAKISVFALAKLPVLLL